ncbi:MAG TPA: helix-turn-helix transcriptional regulator [Solirubrobacteraceae bacterium]|nr:helix-turn-helix transcriptional regulator [Solirubrobacteraceae bacterium]
MSTQLDIPRLDAGTDAGQCGPEAGEAWPQEELYYTLYCTDNWVSVVGVLHGRIGLTQAQIALGAGVSQATVARWLESGPDLPVRASDRLDDLRCVTLWLLRRGMSERLIAFWLSARNIYLGIDPLQAIAEGRFEQVLDVAHAFVQARPPALA